MMNDSSGKTWSMLLDKMISLLKKWIIADDAKSGQSSFCILLV